MAGQAHNFEERKKRKEKHMAEQEGQSGLIGAMYLRMAKADIAIVIMIITFYVLFGDDIRLAFTSKGADGAFDALNLISLFIFIFELVVTYAADRKYRGSFYFWVDFVAIVTMIPDITFMWEPILDAFAGDADGSGGSSSADSVTSASLSGAKSAKVVRIIRIVRLTRLVRLAKLWKSYGGGDVEIEEEEMNEEPSNVGTKLNEKTMRKVIMIVLSMLILTPFFEYSFYRPVENEFKKYGLQYLYDLSNMDDFEITEAQFGHFSAGYLNGTSVARPGRILHIAMSGKYPWVNETLQDEVKSYCSGNEDPCYYAVVDQIKEDFRNEEVEMFELFGPLEEGKPGAIVYFDKTREVKADAGGGIARTIFVMIVLVWGASAFNKDAQKLVIGPIERMVKVVKGIQANPMASVVMADDDEFGEESYETVMLQHTIEKIGGLLQVGFGEAGAEIIAKNMNTADGKLNAMVPGQRMTAVFGFCDIRNFTDTTECLQQEVMVYVNRVGEIVHGATHDHYGAANKNIGDAFLLVWRVEDTSKTDHRGNMCNSALTAFLKVLIDLKNANQKGGSLYDYTVNPTILERFGEGFEIRLGMGLHIGWAIEGAIGSKYKIDASYLSPNVNMAARLEAATKQFLTPLLLSHWFVDGLTEDARKYCRQIDCVTVKGSIEPMGLYTCDIVHYPQQFAVVEQSRDRAYIDFLTKGVPEIQQGIHNDFFPTFQNAMDDYKAGNWKAAHDHLTKALELKPEDGPSVALDRVMKRSEYAAPADWKGYRALTEK